MLIIATYMGRPATELTREELIEAYTWACQELADEREWHKGVAEVDRLLDAAEARRLTGCE